MTASLEQRHPDDDASRATPLRTAALGISTAPICGVRDYQELLSQALRREGCECGTHWLERDDGSLARARARIGAWTAALPSELAASGAEVALLHYSVFAFSHRGLPLFAHPVLSAVKRARIPLVTILHEFVYPWGRDGLRGATWAVTQRVALIEVMRASDAVLTTTDFQARWLRSRLRPWLARRETAVAPVFSNLPAPQGRVGASTLAAAAPAIPPAPEGVATIGLFGFAYRAPTISLVVEALGLLQSRGVAARVALLGAPGRASPAGRLWQELARAAGLAREPAFSGALPRQQLANALSACEALLFIDPIGPNSRKTTLAASLAAGRPVVALDGPRRFGELAEAGAAEIVQPRASAVADALARLLADGALADSLGARGREFAARRMSPERAARTIAGLLEEAARRAV